MAGPMLSVVQERGQVTIPARIRKRWGLEKGSLVSFVETQEGVLIVPREAVASAALEAIGKALREHGVTLEDLVESGRDIRAELIEEIYGLAEE